MGIVAVKAEKSHNESAARGEKRLASAILSVLLLHFCPLAAAELNDTGITAYADQSGHGLATEPADFPGQDARYGRDAAALAGKLTKVGGGSKGFDFTKLDAKGKGLPADDPQWACVRDNVTGLIWEVKTADGGLRDREHTYSWYNPDSRSNGGDAGVSDGGKCGGSIKCDTYAYVQAVNAQRLCGFDDWRMPQRRELRSLMDYSKADPDGPPTIDETYFPNMPVNPPLKEKPTFKRNLRLPDNKWFWTAAPYAEAWNFAWRMTFRDGNDGLIGKKRPCHALLVRGGK